MKNTNMRFYLSPNKHASNWNQLCVQQTKCNNKYERRNLKDLRGCNKAWATRKGHIYKSWKQKCLILWEHYILTFIHTPRPSPSCFLFFDASLQPRAYLLAIHATFSFFFNFLFQALSLFTTTLFSIINLPLSPQLWIQPNMVTRMLSHI